MTVYRCAPDWTQEIEAKWQAVVENLNRQYPGIDIDWGSVSYFTPRPWRNEYDRGSVEEGFTYVARGPRDSARDVWQSAISRLPHPPGTPCPVGVSGDLTFLDD